jgi:hypothetical protein
MAKQQFAYVDPNPTRTRRSAVAEEAITKYTPSAAVQAKLRAAAKDDPDLFATELLSILIGKVAA